MVGRPGIASMGDRRGRAGAEGLYPLERAQLWGGAWELPPWGSPSHKGLTRARQVRRGRAACLQGQQLARLAAIPRPLPALHFHFIFATWGLGPGLRPSPSRVLVFKVDRLKQMGLFLCTRPDMNIPHKNQ